MARRPARLAGAALLTSALLASVAATPAGATVYGTHEVHGAIETSYLAAGGPTGVLGLPLTDELPTPGGVGRFNHFSGGSIYWTSRTGAHVVRGAVRDRWAQTGWERGPLGYPVAEQQAVGASVVQRFSGGIVVSSSSGTHEVHGAILETYLREGGPLGAVGVPLTDEKATPGGVGRFNHFSGGSIYWSPTTEAALVSGAVLDTWQGLGWERGPLGYPTTGLYVDERGERQQFQHGSVSSSPRTGTNEVYGAIFETYLGMGRELGNLGYPRSGEYDIPGGRRSDFEHGSITWTPAEGTVGAVDVPVPAPGPVPPGTTVVTGAGSRTVTVPAGPSLLRMHRTGKSSDSYDRFEVYAEQSMIAQMFAGYDAVIWFRPSWSYNGDNTLPYGGPRHLRVVSDTSWELDVIPLSGAASFGKGITIGEQRSTVWRYVGAEGTAHLSFRNTSGAGTLSIWKRQGQYYNSYGPNAGNDLSAPISPGDYVQVVTPRLYGGRENGELDTPWTLTVT